jgi:1-acyl-sn-glycerol-3-phosphate acyltransferase
MSTGRARAGAWTLEAPRADAARPSTRGGRGGFLLDLLGQTMDPSDLANRDPEFIRRVAPILYQVGKYYFRGEGEGMENIPATGPFIAVGNHSGGPILSDVWVMGAWWAMEVGVERPVYLMVHDTPFRVPVLNNFLMKVGALRASRENAEKALSSGAGLLVYPGGELDCLRSFRQRNTIDLQGRTGFIELAFTYGVPILPFVCIGGHEVYFTLFSSQRLARWTGIERLTRVKTVPLIFGLPWGVWWTGFVPYLPLPSKLVYKTAQPIPFERNPDLAKDKVVVRRVYRQVVDIMQGMMDDLARRRRFPVIG